MINFIKYTKSVLNTNKNIYLNTVLPTTQNVLLIIYDIIIF